MKKRKILIVEDLSKSFEDKRVLKKINFDLNESEILFLLGKNGVGKSTLIKIIAGIILKDSGKIQLINKNLRDNIGYISSNDRSFFFRLTAFENLKYFSMMRNISAVEAEHEINRLANALALNESRLHKKVMELSSGEKKKVAIIRAFIHNPELLLLDEPTESLDASSREYFYKLLEEKISSNKIKACIFTTHQIQECLNLGSKCLILGESSSKMIIKDDFSKENLLGIG